MSKFIKQAEVHLRLRKLACAAKYIRRKRKQQKRAAYKRAISNGSAAAIGAGIGGLIGGGLGYGFGAKDDKLFSTLLGAGSGAGIGGLAGYYSGFGEVPDTKEEETKDDELVSRSTITGPTQLKPDTLVPVPEILTPETKDPNAASAAGRNNLAAHQTEAHNANVEAQRRDKEIDSNPEYSQEKKEQLKADNAANLTKTLNNLRNRMDADTIYMNGDVPAGDIIDTQNDVMEYLGDGIFGQSVGVLAGGLRADVNYALGRYSDNTVEPVDAEHRLPDPRVWKHPDYVSTNELRNLRIKSLRPQEFMTNEGEQRYIQIIDDIASGRKATSQDADKAMEQLRKESPDNSYFYTLDDLVQGEGESEPKDYSDIIYPLLASNDDITPAGWVRLNNAIENMHKRGIPVDNDSVALLLKYVMESPDNIYNFSPLRDDLLRDEFSNGTPISIIVKKYPGLVNKYKRPFPLYIRQFDDKEGVWSDDEFRQYLDQIKRP